MKTLETKHEEATLKVLETWKGTPEELGATLYDATDRVRSVTEDGRRADRERIAAARRRLFDVIGGKELFQLEQRLQEFNRI